MRSHCRPFVALALVAMPACLGAQAVPQTDGRPAPLAAGTMVRVTTTGGERLSGTLMDPHRDTLVLATGRADFPLARMIAASDLAQVEAVQGTRTSKARDAAVGAALGAGLAALVGYLGADHGSDCKPSQQSFCLDFHEIDEAASTVLGAILGGIGGGAIGLYVGSKPSEDWRPVNVQPYLQRVGDAPSALQRFGLRGSLAF